jgi:hypothetical protein
MLLSGVNQAKFSEFSFVQHAADPNAFISYWHLSDALLLRYVAQSHPDLA